MSVFLDKIIVWGLIVVIVVTALLHGVVEPWSELVFELLVIALVLLWAIKACWERCLTVSIPTPVWPLLALTGLGLAQSIVWTDGAGQRQSLSLDVEATRGTVLVLICLLLCCLLAANFLTGRERLQKLAKFLTFYGAGLAVLGLMQKFTASESVFWLRRIETNSPFGPFINRDHFAGYMELLFALPVALLVLRCVRGEARLLYGAAAVIMALAAIFTLSRGGMIALLAEVLFIAALGLKYQRQARPSRSAASGRGSSLVELSAAGLILAAIVLGVLWIGAEPVINRLATGDPDNSDLAKAQTFDSVRGEIWRDTWQIIRHNPLLGVGLGAFETAYPRYSQDTGMRGVVAEAHNDYLQILADAGLVGGLLALWFIWTVWRALLSALRARDPLLASVALGSGAGVFGLLVHSLFDFNLHLPSHALLFLVLSVVVAQLAVRAAAPAPQVAAAPAAVELFQEASS